MINKIKEEAQRLAGWIIRRQSNLRAYRHMLPTMLEQFAQENSMLDWTDARAIVHFADNLLQTDAEWRTEELYYQAVADLFNEYKKSLLNIKKN